jgi:hypothetical protein
LPRFASAAVHREKKLNEITELVRLAEIMRKGD